MAGFVMIYILGLILVFSFPPIFPLFYAFFIGTTYIVFSDIFDAWNGILWRLFMWVYHIIFLYWAYVYLWPLRNNETFIKEILEIVLTILFFTTLIIGIGLVSGAYKELKVLKRREEKISITKQVMFRHGLGYLCFAIIVFIILSILLNNPS
tara:strand:+ start:3677 stop:4132 length:456 start_codon:yes stop_codon:yes gene_type:complete